MHYFFFLSLLWIVIFLVSLKPSYIHPNWYSFKSTSCARSWMHFFLPSPSYCKQERNLSMSSICYSVFICYKNLCITPEVHLLIWQILITCPRSLSECLVILQVSSSTQPRDTLILVTTLNSLFLSLCCLNNFSLIRCMQNLLLFLAFSVQVVSCIQCY